MNLITTKQKNILTGAAFAFLSLALGACTSTADIAGPAAAGLSNTETSTEAPAENPTPEIPTATPIPAATGHIIFTSDRDGTTDLYMVTSDSTETTRITVDASVDESGTPQLSPDGTRVAFAATIGNNTDIYVVDLASKVISRITNSEGKDSSPSWSPDGSRLVFESSQDGNFEIYAINADGSNLIRLTNEAEGDNNPVWSPNSGDIVFSSGRFGNADLLLTSLNGSFFTLTTNPGPDNNPVWSPDGSRIAYLEYLDGLTNICVIGRDGLNRTCITPNPGYYQTPVWSPDGNRIAAIEGTSIYIISVADRQVQELSQAGIEPLGIPTWSPDGLRLAFQASANGNMEIFQVLILNSEFTQITVDSGVDGKPVWTAN